MSRNKKIAIKWGPRSKHRKESITQIWKIDRGVIVTSLIHLKLWPNVKICLSSFDTSHASLCGTLKVRCLLSDIGNLITSSQFYRCSYQSCSVNKGVLKNVANFLGKHLCESLFDEVADLKPATVLNRGCSTGVSCELCKFYQMPIL